jgi:pyruvate/2-oxoglutarate dehydrogenase complex dihydrolipoamide acyltransferase (E2) component
MQNEITSPIDGVVREVHCSPGDQVGLDALLAVVGPAGAAESEATPVSGSAKVKSKKPKPRSVSRGSGKKAARKGRK